MQTTINESELFEMGVHYVRQVFLSEGYEEIQYQEPPFVPQFILNKNDRTYFLYIKVQSAPFDLEEIFSNDEINGYVWSCQKRGVGLLLSGIVFSNASDPAKSVNKLDRIEIDYTGLINLFE
jgi:hypothetical protein